MLSLAELMARPGVTFRVFCCVCGQAHDPRGRDVLYRSDDRRWWCRNGTACFARRDTQGVPEGMMFA